MNRRNAIKTLMGYAGKMSTSLFPLSALGVTPDSWSLGPSKLKRVIFFLQNQGFDPETCINNFENAEGKLSTIGLAPPMQALEPLMHKMHIISGLHGIHTTPGHSAYFGALGGYRGGLGVAPSGSYDRLCIKSDFTPNNYATPRNWC